MDPRYLIDYLKDPTSDPEKRRTSEFRLLCSGLMFSGNRPVHNIYARLLLAKPFTLAVAMPITARPHYPQEWSLRISIAAVTESANNMTRTLMPDYEIASDLAALLTLLCRRLITVAGNVSISEKAPIDGAPDWLSTMPVPIVTKLSIKHWPDQPSIYVSHPTRPELNHPEPQVKRFESDRVERLLWGLPRIQHAGRFVLAARLYAAAMTILFERTDIAYALMTMSVEALANHAVTAPDARETAKRNIPPKFQAKGKEQGLTEEQVKAMWESMAEGRSTFKFARFMKDNVTDELWTPDDLFNLKDALPHLIPTREQFEERVNDVYVQRNKFVHHGEPYPYLSEWGLSPYGNSAVLGEIFSGVKFPPFPWFERAVHICLVNYIEKQIAGLYQPPSNATADPAGPAARSEL